MARLKNSRHQNKYFKPSDKIIDDKPIEVRIERFSHDGRGVAMVKGKTTFVDNVIPGELVKIKFIEQRKKFNSALLLTLIDKSAHRVAPDCNVYQSCGGCQLQHMSYQQQLALKVEQWQYQLIKLQNNLGLAAIDFLPAIESQPFHYRLRVKLGLDVKKGVLGFKQVKSHKLVAVENCSLLDNQLNEFLAELTLWLKELPAPRKFVECLVSGFASDASDDSLNNTANIGVVFYINESLTEQDMEKIRRFNASKPYFIDIAYQDKPYALLLNTTAQPFFHYSINDVRIEYSVTDFTQVNRDVNEEMIKQLIQLLDLKATDHVIDLFSGIGNISLPIARQVASLQAYELADTMVEKLHHNARLNNITNIQAFVKDLNSAMIHFDGIHKIILDPPRAGAEHCCQLLADFVKNSEYNPVIAYISCNPQTQIRDIKPLLEAGYMIDKAIPMDMFAQTAHLESLLILKKT